MAQTLPDHLELAKLTAAGMTQEEIAARYGVSQSAVSAKLTRNNRYAKGAQSPVSSALPWNIANHPEKRRITNQAAFRGLRYLVRQRMGDTLTERAFKDLRNFLDHVREGEVLALGVDGFEYVPRRETDGELVIRWPEGVPRDRVKEAYLRRPTEGLWAP